MSGAMSGAKPVPDGSAPGRPSGIAYSRAKAARATMKSHGIRRERRVQQRLAYWLAVMPPST